MAQQAHLTCRIGHTGKEFYSFPVGEVFYFEYCFAYMAGLAPRFAFTGMHIAL